MLRMVEAIGKNVYKKNLIKIILAFTCWPYLVVIISLLNKDFLGIEGANISGIGFLSLFYSISHSIFIPIALIIFLAVNLFYDEYREGQISFYKDLCKKKVHNSKLIVIFSTYFMFIAASVINLLIVYLLFFRNTVSFSSELIGPYYKVQLFTMLVLIMSEIVCIHIGTLLSISFNSAYAIIGGFVYFVLTRLASRFGFVKYIFFEGYLEYESIESAFINIALLFIVLNMVIHFISNRKIAVKEFV